MFDLEIRGVGCEIRAKFRCLLCLRTRVKDYVDGITLNVVVNVVKVNLLVLMLVLEGGVNVESC